MNAMAQVHELPPPGRSLTAAHVREHVNLIQEVMQAVMKKDTHYGVIPGCKLPSLYKAGSEVLLSTFRIAVSVRVEDLSTPDSIRYRVTVTGTHQQSGVVVGEGIGECSSDESKYRWRRCYVKQEFETTPESRRRIKFVENKQNPARPYENMEVRTEPADVANTILKMAKKRAQIDMTLTATAASDCFAQDIEDLPEELRDRDEGEAQHQRQPAKPPYGPYPEADFARNLPSWLAVISDGRKTAEEIIAMVESKGSLTDKQKEAIRAKPEQAQDSAKAESIEGQVVAKEEAA